MEAATSAGEGSSGGESKDAPPTVPNVAAKGVASGVAGQWERGSLASFVAMWCSPRLSTPGPKGE